MAAVTIDQLAAQLAAARSEESLAKGKRIQIEEAIIAQVSIGEAQRVTLKTGNGLNLTLQSGLNYKLSSDFPEGLIPVKQTIKIELDVKQYEELRLSSPVAFAEASEWVTVTPKKTSVTLAVI